MGGQLMADLFQQTGRTLARHLLDVPARPPVSSRRPGRTFMPSCCPCAGLGGHLFHQMREERRWLYMWRRCERTVAAVRSRIFPIAAAVYPRECRNITWA